MQLGHVDYEYVAAENETPRSIARCVSSLMCVCVCLCVCVCVCVCVCRCVGVGVPLEDVP